jgi:hypothetical protein
MYTNPMIIYSQRENTRTLIWALIKTKIDVKLMQSALNIDVRTFM